MQVCKEIESLATGRFPRLTSVYGGQSMSEQLRALKRGTEIVVGTPGRVKDDLPRSVAASRDDRLQQLHRWLERAVESLRSRQCYVHAFGGRGKK